MEPDIPDNQQQEAGIEQHSGPAGHLIWQGREEAGIGHQLGRGQQPGAEAGIGHQLGQQLGAEAGIGQRQGTAKQRGRKKAPAKVGGEGKKHIIPDQAKAEPKKQAKGKQAKKARSKAAPKKAATKTPPKKLTEAKPRSSRKVAITKKAEVG